MNLTDHDSRPMRTHGFKPLQGYNAQLAVNEQQVVVAAELTCDSPDFGHLEPMVRATRRELRGVDLGDPSVVFADAGYWHQRQIETIATTASKCSSRRTPACAGARAPVGAAASTTSCDACSRPRRPRALPPTPGTLEPVFGQLKFNRDFRRFQRRGRAACRSEWRLIAATHNLLKLHRHQLTAATA